MSVCQRESASQCGSSSRTREGNKDPTTRAIAKRTEKPTKNSQYTYSFARQRRTCFSRILRKLVTRKILIVSVVPHGSCFALDPRQDGHEIVNGFVVFVAANQSAALDNVLGHVGRKEDPAFLAVQQGIPRVGRERVNVHARATPLGADQDPAVGWAARFRYEAKEVVPKVGGDAVILQHGFGVFVVFKGTIEDIQGTVVSVVVQVSEKVLHSYLD